MARQSANVSTALGNGVDQAFFAEQSDRPPSGGAGYFEGFDELGFGGDAGALGVFAGFDACAEDGGYLAVGGYRASRIDLGHRTRLTDQAQRPM
jgi:hypothetical protein